MYWYVGSLLCGTSRGKFSHTVNNLGSYSLIATLFPETNLVASSLPAIIFYLAGGLVTRGDLHGDHFSDLDRGGTSQLV